MDTETCMNEPWSSCFIKPPPACTVVTVVRQSDIKDMKNILFSAINTLYEMKVFKTEGAILSRFLYRYKRLFRQDKGFQQLAKVNQAIKRYYSYSIAAAMKRLKNCFPPEIPPDGAQIHLPTQQLLKWVLLRLLSNAKIFLRIINLCVIAGRFIYGRLYMGWSASYTMFALAVTSRIWTLAKYVLLKIIEWYDQLRIHLPILTETIDFLPGFEFPKKMEDFIGHIDLRPPLRKTDIDKIFELIDLTRGDESGEDDDVILMDEIINTVSSDSEIEISSDEVIVEKERIWKKERKGVGDNDVAVLYEKRKKPAPKLAPLKRRYFAEDLGEPVDLDEMPPKQKKFKGKKRKKGSDRKI